MEFVGHKGAALLDLWSIAHFLLGMAFGRVPAKILTMGRFGFAETSGTPRNISIVHECFFVLLLAYGWELIEFSLEAGLAGPEVAFWLQGHEHLVNRIVSDPVLVLLGYWFSHSHAPWAFWPSRILLLVWCYVFLFIMPHSMAYTG